MNCTLPAAFAADIEIVGQHVDARRFAFLEDADVVLRRRGSAAEAHREIGRTARSSRLGIEAVAAGSPTEKATRSEISKYLSLSMNVTK